MRILTYIWIALVVLRMMTVAARAEEVTSAAEVKPAETAPIAAPVVAPPVVEAPPPAAAPAPEVKSESGRGFQIGLAVYYSFAKEAEFDGEISSGGVNIDFDGKYHSEEVPGFALSIITKGSGAWGAEFGLAKELDRKVDSFELHVGNVSTAGDYTTSVPEMSLLILYGNARLYARDDVYFLGGLNLTKIDLSNSTIDIDTGYGLQIGAGLQATEQISLEAQYRWIFTTAEESGVFTDGTPYQATYEKIELSGLNLLVRYSF